MFRLYNKHMSTTTTTMVEEELPVIHFNWGQKRYLTSKQTKALDELREICVKEILINPSSDPILNDELMLRFLRDRRFHVEKALDRIRKDAEWRKQFEGEPDLNSFPELLDWHQNGAFYWTGNYDNDGRPLIILKLCKIFPNRIKDIKQVVSMIKFYFDSILEIAARKGFSEISAVGDMAGWSIRENFNLSLVASMTELSTAHFPETTGRVFLVNLPWTFNAALTLIRPFVDERQMSRVVNCWDKSEFRKIHEHIDPAILEVEYGGTHAPYTLPDPIMARLLKKEETALDTGGAGVANSVAEARRRKFRTLAWPAVRQFVASAIFALLALAQSTHAETVLGSLFGAFLFSVAGVALWAGWQGMKEAAATLQEEFPEFVDQHGKKIILDREHAALGEFDLKAIVTSCRITDDHFVEYRIDCSLPARSWVVWRRYSQFHNCFTRSSVAQASFKSSFPSKRWTGDHLSKTFIDDRKSELNQFLITFLKDFRKAHRVESTVRAFFSL